MTYDPNRYTGLLQHGMDRLGEVGGASFGAYQKEQQLDGQLPPALQQYIERLMKGEDPQALAQEARANPEIAAILGGKPPQQPAAQSMVGSLGMRNGTPSVMPPGTINPAAAQNPAPTIQQPRDRSQSLGSMADHAPQGFGYPASPPPSQQPNSLGNVAAEALAMGAPAGSTPGPQRAPVQPTPLAQGSVSRPPSMSTALPGQAPAQAPSPAPQSAAAPTAKGMTWRDFNRVKDILPTMEASRSRQEVAKTNAKGKVDVANINNLTRAFITRAVEEGRNERDIAENLIKIQRIESDVEKAALYAQVKQEVAAIQASATLGAARERASSSSGDVVVKSLTQQYQANKAFLGKYTNADRTLMPRDVQQKIYEAEQEQRAIEADLAQRGVRLNMREPAAGPFQPQTPFKPPAGTKPAAKPVPAGPREPPRDTRSSSSSSTPGAKMRVRYKVKTKYGPPGTEVQIDPAKFNAAYHEKV